MASIAREMNICVSEYNILVCRGYDSAPYIDRSLRGESILIKALKLTRMSKIRRRPVAGRITFNAFNGNLIGTWSAKS